MNQPLIQNQITIINIILVQIPLPSGIRAPTMPSPPAPTLAFVEYITKLPSYEEIVFGVDFLSVDIAVVDCRVSKLFPSVRRINGPYKEAPLLEFDCCPY